MSIDFNPICSSIPQSFQITDSKPISIRIAPENKIDEINRSPNSKKLYNAGIIGGSLGTVLAAGLAIGGMLASKKTTPILKELNKGMTAVAGVVSAAILAIPFAFAGSKLAQTLTVFVKTRGSDKTEKL